MVWCACCSLQYTYTLRILTLRNTYTHGIMHTIHINTKNIRLENNYNYCNYNQKINKPTNVETN